MNAKIMSDFDFSNFQLIYHKDGISTSPFDLTITNIVRNNNIFVICPYIGIEYFNRIISLANSWKLITDVEEWILSQNDNKNRLMIIDFIKENNINIHHIKNVHAKVMLTNKQALIGSANFTDSGIRKKIEISILIQEKKYITELNKWFDNIWDNCKDVSHEELVKFYNSIKTTYRKKIVSDQKYSLSSPKVFKKNLVDLNLDNAKTNIKGDDHKVEERLIKILKYYPNKKWIEDYLNVVKMMLDTLQIHNDDIRLSMVIPKNGKRLPVNIGQRWIIRPYVDGKIGMIMPLDYKESDFEKKDGVIKEDADYFYINKREIARWLHFDRKYEVKFSSQIIKFWLIAINNELQRTKKSGRRFAHQTLFFELVTNYSYREAILNKSFNS